MITKSIKSAIWDGNLLIRYGGRVPLRFARLEHVRFQLNRPEDPHHGCRFYHKKDDHEISVTVSLGTATYLNKEVTDIQQLISMADEAMYNAKNSGRNRVISV